MQHHGVLLVNLGTPEAPTQAGVGKFLREFLIDSRVIDLPTWLRYVLVYILIVPFRSRKLARAYKLIWDSNGSPLLINSYSLVNALQLSLGSQYIVALGMRYGQPSLSTALHALDTCNKITILPLYPQYSSAATGSAIEKILSLLNHFPHYPNVQLIRDFYQHSGFIIPQSELIALYLPDHDYILFSFHGLPLRQLHASCRKPCAGICPKNNNAYSEPACYRAQCFATARAIANQIDIPEHQYSVVFQSRLGNTQWIEPYIEHILPQLAAKGVKHLMVACPSFVTN